MIIKHFNDIDTNVRYDGNFDEAIVRINDTGSSSIVPDGDRYKHTINHGLQRIPIGCQVIMSDEFTNVRVIERDKQKIIVQFDKARAFVHLRIW